MLESGMDSSMVAALMGHSDLSMLGRVYAHLLQNPENLLTQFVLLKVLGNRRV